MQPRQHRFDTETQLQADAATGDPTGVFRYRWKCTCGRVGPWKSGGAKRSGQHAKAARSARVGGERHVAAMERGT